jgi:hypothetical protein
MFTVVLPGSDLTLGVHRCIGFDALFPMLWHYGAVGNLDGLAFGTDKSPADILTTLPDGNSFSFCNKCGDVVAVVIKRA